MSLPTNAKGTSLPVRQPDRVAYDTIRGQTRFAVWKCIDQAQIDFLAGQAAALQLPYSTSSTGTTVMLEIEIVGGSINPTQIGAPVDRWEMPANELQKNGWAHPKSLVIDPDAAVYSERCLQDGKSLQTCLDEMAAMDPSPTDGWGADEFSAHQAVYELCSSGSTHFALGQYVLRHTTNVSAAYQANVADLNVERLYTTQQLLVECTNPLYWTLPLPGRLQFRIRNIAAPIARAGYLWSWRKLPSAESSTAGGRIEIVTEYWLEQWSTYYYDPVT
jgi:hypothetical protein